jgi:acyl-CoA synthetase (AMP-forming)/AMP-acid ligase II
MYGLCLLEPDLASFDLSHWRLGVYGSAPMPEPTIRRFSEAVPHTRHVQRLWRHGDDLAGYHHAPGEGLDQSDSIGKTVPCGEIRVMDDSCREVSPGDLGELWIRGPMVVPGYWNNPAATEASFVCGFWRSGDIGSVDEAGFVRIADRKKDMINRGGYKIFPAEVENVLCDHADIVEAAVIGRPDEILGERAVAFVRASRGGISESEVRSFCSARLADYKVPDRIFIDTEPLPRNANGKLQKDILRSSSPPEPLRPARAS